MTDEDWEKTDFPIVCETCLGDNPYVRMMRAEMDKECKVCTTPFTVFRWKAGSTGRFKKTEICQTCSKLKNVCQTCLLDLSFGLPVAARDAIMPEGSQAEVAVAGANKLFQHNINAKKIADGELPFDRVQYDPLVAKMARTGAYYERNKAQICSFFVKGECYRGDTCPYRHEIPEIKEGQEDLAHQKIRDRYYGVNDPVAKRMLTRVSSSAVAPPADKDIKTLYVGNLDPKITEADLRDHFYYFGEIASIKMMLPQKCAFVEFTGREAAEKAIAKNQKLIVKGVYLRTAWAKPTRKKIVAKPGAPVAPPMGQRPSYPSMDPSRMGAAPAPAPTLGGMQTNPPGNGAMPKPNWAASSTDGEGPPTKKARVGT